MPFRFFLLSLCLVFASAQAQEGSDPAAAAPEAAPPANEAATQTPPAAAKAEAKEPEARTAEPKAAETADAEKPAVTAVPLDAAALVSVGIPRSRAERDEMAQRAALLKEEAALRKAEAEKALSDATPICWKKFLVSACLDDAKVAYRKDISIARRQERQSQSLERNVRKYDAAEHARLRDEENARKDEENARKAAEFRAKQEAKGRSLAN